MHWTSAHTNIHECQIHEDCDHSDAAWSNSSFRVDVLAHMHVCFKYGNEATQNTHTSAVHDVSSITFIVQPSSFGWSIALKIVVANTGDVYCFIFVTQYVNLLCPCLNMQLFWGVYLRHCEYWFMVYNQIHVSSSAQPKHDYLVCHAKLTTSHSIEDVFASEIIAVHDGAAIRAVQDNVLTVGKQR